MSCASAASRSVAHHDTLGCRLLLPLNACALRTLAGDLLAGEDVGVEEELLLVAFVQADGEFVLEADAEEAEAGGQERADCDVLDLAAGAVFDHEAEEAVAFGLKHALQHVLVQQAG